MERRPGYYKKIDFVFFNEKRIRDAVNDERYGVKARTERNGSGMGDPTASEAIRNITPLISVRLGDGSLEFPEHWLKVIDATKLWAQGDRLVVALDYYAGEIWKITAAKLSISMPTYYRLLDDVRNYASLCAVQLGLIKIL